VDDGAPSGLSARDRAKLPAPRIAEDDDEPVVTVSAAPPEEDDDAPELFFSSDPSDDDAGLGVEALGVEALDDGRSTVPSPPPASTPAPAPAPAPSMASAPPPGLAAPKLVSAAYSVSNVAEETVVPPRRSRTRSDRPSSIASARTETSNADPTEDGGALHDDPAPARRSRSRSHSSPPPRGGANVRADEPSIIVDMGSAVDDLLGELLRAAQDEEGVLVAALLRMGDAALPMLTQAFPGPLWFDRHATGRRPARGRDVSAVARALHAFGPRAAPYVASLLGSSQPEKRFCALLLAGDLVHPNLLDATLARLLDDDERVRQLASELAPRFRGASGWDEQMTLLRRAARIAGKDPARRLRAISALGTVGDAGALETLVRLLEDDAPEVVRAAHAALVLLAAEDLGASARRWAAWSQEHGSRHRIEWLIDALTHADEALRTRAGDELKQLTQQYFGFHPGTSRREREVAQEKYRRWWEAEGRQQFA
jgi:hypothetical protein